MAGYLWQVTAKQNNGKVVKGMSVEIYKTGTSSKPNLKEISEALNNKYNTNVHESHCGASIFDFKALK